MPISEDRVTKELDLRDYGILELSSALQIEARRLISELLVAEINGTMDEAKSPVSGGKWRARKKDGSTSVLLEDGDLRDAINARIRGNTLEVGVFDRSETPKAFAHNTGYKNHPHIPEGRYFRQFIPDEDQSFIREIEQSINDVIDALRGNERAAERTQERFTVNDALNVTQVRGAPELFTAADIVGDLFGEN